MPRSWSPLDNRIVLAADKGSGAAAAGGTAGPLGSEVMRRRATFARDVSASFGQLVSLMMRQRQYKHTMLAELEWLVVPALASRQFRVVEGVSQDKGLVAPVAAVLWASVSAEIDKRFTDNIELPLRLKPQEWRSGPNIWIIETLGDAKAVTMTLQHLMQADLKGKTVRMRVRGKDGKIAVGRVELQPDAAAAQPAGG